MNRFKIPVAFQDSYNRRPLLLLGKEYEQQICYFEREDRFYLTLLWGKVVILNSKKLMMGINMLDLSMSTDKPPGELFLYDLDKPSNPRFGREASWDLFGDRVILVYQEV